MGRIIGIDLGTTNTVVCVIQDGEPKVITTREGLTHIPSVVCYDTEDDLFYCGQAAKDWMPKEPKNTVYSVKRLMGMHFFDEVRRDGENQNDRNRFFQIERKVGYRLRPDPEGRDDVVRILLGEEKYFKPEQISAMILKQAKEDAERFLNGEEVTGAVITVPAYFEEKQIAATHEAGKLAGLDVKHILKEPTAAAIAAGYNQNVQNRYVLVYDLGGGTFDVSLLQMNDNNFTVDGLGGNNWLGGDNFDEELVTLAAENVRASHNYDPLNEPEFRTRIKRHVEFAKQQLSETRNTVIGAMDVCTVPVDREKGKRRKPVSVNLPVSRDTFEEKIRHYIVET